MTFLPIVERELRVAARRPVTYWGRFGAALGVMAVWIALVLCNRRMGTAQLSSMLFVSFGVIALGYCMLAGIFLTADCLSEEKREGTLGLLFLTNLRGYDVVLGKLMATSTHAVYALLAMLPVLGLPLLMGGVTVGEFWRMVLVLLVTLFVSLSLGLFASALSREARQAMAGTVLGMILLAGVPPALYWLPFAGMSSVGWKTVLLPSPGFAFGASFASHYATRSGHFQYWSSVQVIFWIGAAFLLISMLALPRAFRVKAGQTEERTARQSASALGLARRWFPTFMSIAPLWVTDIGIFLRWKRRRLLERNPYVWLVSRESAFEKVGWAVVCLLFLVWFVSLASSCGASKRTGPPWDFIVSMFTAYALHQAVKYGAAVEASRRLSEDKRSGALELLLVTPLREGAILEGLPAAMRIRLAGPRRMLLLVNLGLIAAIVFWPDALDIHGHDTWIFFELFMGGLLVVYSDLRAIGMAGTWLALKSKRHNRAVLGTLGRVLVPSWVAVFLLIFWMNNHNVGENQIWMIFGSWYVVGLVADLIVIRRARAGLSKGIRYWLTGDRPPHLLQPTPYRSIASFRHSMVPYREPSDLIR